MTKGRLGLLLLSVLIVAFALSGCFLPSVEDHTPPTIAVSPSPITAYSGQSFSFNVTANDPSGVQSITAEFLGVTKTATMTKTASFTFTAPVVGQASQYDLEVTAVDNSKFHNKSQPQTVHVNVYPITTGTVTYAVKLNKPNAIYTYPTPGNEGSVQISIDVFGGANLLSGVNVFVDGVSIPASKVSFVTTASAESSPIQVEYTAFYLITKDHVGPHKYYVGFYGANGNLIQQSTPAWFYITYPSAQKVELSAATPLHHGSYVTGDISFTATATDYTSNYEAFLINGTPYATLVNMTTGATKIVDKVYAFDNINTASMTDGSYTFMFKDKSIDGKVATDAKTYIVDNTPPTLRASYKGIPSSGNTLYVGANPTAFDVYAYDTNWMSSAATLGTQPFALTKNGTALADVAGLSNGATEAFTAWVKDYADHETTLALTIIRDTVPPVIHAATITTGLATVNGVPYSASATITVEASVTDPNLKSVAFVLDGPSYTFPMTKNASTGLWTAEVDLTSVLPGTYHASIIATDLALNEATFDTVPATVNVYRSLTNVFTTSLETTPSTPVNGFVKSATITVNINPDWIYAIKTVYLYKGSTISASQTGTASAVYYFTTFTGTGTYHVVVEDTVNATVTDGKTYDVNIDNTPPSSLSISPATPTVNATAQAFAVSATDTESGVASLELQYQSLGSTGANNGAWYTIGTIATSSGTITWNNLNTLPDGKYNIKLIATDGVGNATSTTSWVINNNAGTPDVTFTFPPTWTNSTSTVVKIGATVNNESDVTITATSGSSTLINFGAAATTSTSYTAYPFTATWSATFIGANATSLAQATVTDLAGISVTATKVIGFDNTKPTIVAPASAPATVAGAATFTVTVHATDNLSAIKSVTIGGVTAALQSTTTVKEFGVLNGTYVATLTAPDYTTSGLATFDIAVFDNADNEATTSVSVYVDVTAPTITVKFEAANSNSATITNNSSETIYVATPASFVWNVTTDSGTAPDVAGTIVNAVSTASGANGISTSKQYALTLTATNPINKKVATYGATVTVVIDSIPPNVSVATPATVISADTSAIATYTATDTYFKSAYLKVYDTNGTLYSTTLVAPVQGATVDLRPYLDGVNGTTVTISLVATDLALNSASTSATFYVDTVDPTITNVYKTKSGSGTMYIQLSEPIATTTSFVASDIKFVQSGLTFYATQVGTYVTFDKPNGLIVITEFVDSNGNVVYPEDIGGTWNVYVSNITDTVGNPIANSGSAWYIAAPATPKPINP